MAKAAKTNQADEKDEALGLDVKEAQADSQESKEGTKMARPEPVECVPCSNAAKEIVYMECYETSSLVRRYKCPNCNRTDKRFRYDRKQEFKRRRESENRDYSAR